MQDQFRPGKAQAAFTFTLLFLLYFFDYADRMVVNSLFPFLKADWGLTDAQCALLGAAVYWSIVVATLPVSILVDRWSRTKVIAGMAVLWSLATAACGLAKTFPQLVAARVAVGIGEAGYAPGGTAMIAAIFPEKRRALMMGIWNASIPLGAAAGIAAGGYIAHNYGWQHAFGVVALPGLLVSLLFFFVKDYKTVKVAKSSDSPDVKAIARGFLGTPSLLFTYAGFAANNFVTAALIMWLPTFFHRVQNIPMDKAGPKGGAIMLMAMAGAPLGGFLTDLWLKKNPNARPLFASASAAVTALIFGSAFLLVPHGSLEQYAVLLAGGLFAATYLPAAAAVTQDVVHPGLRAVSYSLCVVSMNLFGASLGQLFVGAVSDQTDIAYALSWLPAFCLASSACFFAASRFYLKDTQRARQEAENAH